MTKALRMSMDEYNAHLKHLQTWDGGSRIPPVQPAKKSKYRNEPTVVDNIRFASKREAQRYTILKLREKAGEIRGLELQPRYLLQVGGVNICTYVADFRYWIGDRLHVEDAKGVRTREYVIKKRLMLAMYGIDISEV